MIPAIRRRRSTAACASVPGAVPCGDRAGVALHAGLMQAGPPLKAGLMQADREGQVWLCEAVIRNGDVADYFLVRLSRLVGGDPVGDPVVLSPTEYESFSRSRGLQAVLL